MRFGDSWPRRRTLLLAFISTAELAQPASNYSNEPKFTSKVLGFVKFGSTTLSDVKKVLEEKKCKQLSWDRPSDDGESGNHSFYCEKFGLPGDPIFDFEVNRNTGLVTSVFILPKDKSVFYKYLRALTNKYGISTPKVRTKTGIGSEPVLAGQAWVFSDVDVILYDGSDWFLGYFWTVPEEEKEEKIEALL